MVHASTECFSTVHLEIHKIGKPQTFLFGLVLFTETPLIFNLGQVTTLKHQAWPIINKLLILRAFFLHYPLITN